MDREKKSNLADEYRPRSHRGKGFRCLFMSLQCPIGQEERGGTSPDVAFRPAKGFQTVHLASGEEPIELLAAVDRIENDRG